VYSAAPSLLVLLAALAVAAPARADFETLDINEGELRFLSEPPRNPPHLHSSHVQITEDTLRSGWVRTRQCHYHLDQVRALQIVFNPARMRQLQILRADNVGRAWIEGPTVQLEDVGANAIVCITSENRTLRRREDGRGWEWRGGPYMRRFLDGYFPMQVKLLVDYPAHLLELGAIEPGALKLKAVSQPGHVRIEALFEGRLDITLRFDATAGTPGIGWQ
jgi:hypothetical protein